MAIASDWFRANKLTLNTKNTIINHSKKQADLKLELNGQSIKETSDEKHEKYFIFLGFRMDNKLS